MLDRPILIVGAPRSGKSLVGNVLRGADEFCVVGEALMTWNIGFGSRADDRRGADEATPELREQIAASCVRELRKTGKERYVDNLAANAMRIPFVDALFPDAKIVFVARDGRGAIPEMLHGWTAKASVVMTARRTKRTLHWRTFPRLALRFARNYLTSRLRSRRSTWGPAPPGLPEFAAGHSAAETAAFQWLAINQVALGDLERLPKDRWLEVRFEQMIDDPAGSFARIAEFVEAKDPGQIVERARHYVDPQNIPTMSQGVRAEPTHSEWASIHELIASMQARLGYES